jgi:hypothetical protein
MTEAPVCVQCGTTGQLGSAFCAACGSALPKSEDTGSGTGIDSTPTIVQAPVVPAAVTTAWPEQTPQAEKTSVAGELTVFPWWQVIVFSIISYGVWTFYWFYCTRKQVSGLVETNRDDPGIQTFGYMVPIWQVWVVRDMWRDINGVAQKAGTVGINAKTYTIWFAICAYVPLVNYVGAIVIPIFYLITQSRLMGALKALNGGVTINRRVTPWSGVWAFGPIVLGVVVGVLTSI